MTRPGIEPRSPGPLANTLTAGPMSRLCSNNIVNFQESTTILNAYTKKSGNLLNAPRTIWGCPRGVMVKAMNCGIVVREFVLQSITFTFGQIHLGKV